MAKDRDTEIDHEIGSDMSFISFPFTSEPQAKDVRSGMEREVMKDMERTEVSKERGLSDVLPLTSVTHVGRFIPYILHLPHS